MRRIYSIATVLCLLLQVSLLAGQLSTQDHLSEPGFWPTQNAASRDNFKGPSACARCHRAKVASAQATPMGGTAMPAGTSQILHSHPQLSFAAKQFHYRIDTDQTASRYSISDGKRSLSFDLVWAFRSVATTPQALPRCPAIPLSLLTSVKVPSPLLWKRLLGRGLKMRGIQ